MIEVAFLNELIKKAFQKSLITDHNHDKNITTRKFNRLKSESLTATLKQATLASKSEIANFVNRTDFNSKLKHVTSNENELNELSKKVKAISWTKNLISKFSILNGAKYFSSGTFQNYLVCIPAINYIKYFKASKRIYSWKSNGMSEESLKNITK